MIAFISIMFLAFGVVSACIGLTNPVCPVHGNEGPVLIAAGVISIIVGTTIALIGSSYYSRQERKREIVVEIHKEDDEAEQELKKKKNNKYFYDMLMENDELYEKCMKNWQVYIKTPVVDAFGDMTHIPDAVIEDVMSEREIVFPERVGTKELLS